MSKNVLILSGSPRKGGNSDILCDEFLKGAVAGGHQAEKIFLRDYNIAYCLGCNACYETGICVQKDDAKQVLDKMLAADVIVMATPVYFYTMDAQMKTLIDRNCPVYESMSDKEFYFIITAADEDESTLHRTLEGFRGYTYCLNNPVEKGVLYATGVWGKNDVKDTPFLKKAYEMGKNL